MRRRDFIKGIGGAATAWPLRARAQQPALPVVALVNLRSGEASVRLADAFRKGLDEAGYVASGKMVANFGGGLTNWPHGFYVDRAGDVWITDGRSENGKGDTVIKFSPQGKVHPAKARRIAVNITE